MDNNGSVRITLDDVYREVKALRKSVDGFSSTANAVQDHERRLRWVERLAWMAIGVAVVSSALIPAFLA